MQGERLASFQVSQEEIHLHTCVFVAGRPSCRKKAIPGSCRIFKREKGYIKTRLNCEGNASVLSAYDKLSALYIHSVSQHTQMFAFFFVHSEQKTFNCRGEGRGKRQGRGNFDVLQSPVFVMFVIMMIVYMRLFFFMTVLMMIIVTNLLIVMMMMMMMMM